MRRLAFGRGATELTPALGDQLVENNTPAGNVQPRQAIEEPFRFAHRHLLGKGYQNEFGLDRIAENRPKTAQTAG